MTIPGEALPGGPDTEPPETPVTSVPDENGQDLLLLAGDPLQYLLGAVGRVEEDSRTIRWPTGH